MMVFCYGVISRSHLGHYLYEKGNVRVHNVPPRFPCTSVPDGVFLPRNPEIPYKWYYWSAEGWTIISMWDMSGDQRRGSNSTFIIQGTMDLSDALKQCRIVFPEVMERIELKQKVLSDG